MPLPSQPRSARHRHIWIPKNPAESPVGLSAEISPCRGQPRLVRHRQTSPHRATPCQPHLPPKESSRGSRSPQCCCRSVRMATPGLAMPHPCSPRFALAGQATLGLTPSPDAQPITPPQLAGFPGFRLQAPPQPQTGRAWAANHPAQPASRHQRQSPRCRAGSAHRDRTGM